MPPLVIFSALVIAATTVVAVTPAQATSQSFAGTTVDVNSTYYPSYLLGSTVYSPISFTSLMPELGSARGANVVVTFLKGGSSLGTCTISAGSTTCGSGAVSLSGLTAGTNVITSRFTMGATSSDFTGTIFAVVATSPTFTLEWQDAAGTWIVGSGGPALPLMGTTALRCSVVNNANAEITWRSLALRATLLPSGSLTLPVTETLAAGATGHYAIYSGSVHGIASANCSGGGTLTDYEGVGGGNGLGITAVDGTIEVDQTPAPGTTVTITGTGVYPGHAASYAVLLDDDAVAGSPVSTTGPDYDFSVDVDVPSDLDPGEHMLKVVETASGKSVAFAAFPFTVAEPPAVELPAGGGDAQLPATGPSLSGNTLAAVSTLALLVTGAGLALVVSARRRRRAE